MGFFDLFKFKKKESHVISPEEVREINWSEQVTIPEKYQPYFERETATRLEFENKCHEIDRLTKIASTETRADLHVNWNNLTNQEKIAFISAEELKLKKIFLLDDVARLKQFLETRPYQKWHFAQACQNRSVSCLKFILENDYIKLEQYIENLKVAILQAAAEKNDLELFKMGQERGLDIHWNDEELFFTAILHGSISIADYYLEQGVSINYVRTDEYDIAGFDHQQETYTPIEVAARRANMHDKIDMLDWVVRNGGDIDDLKGMELRAECKDFVDRYLFAQNLDATLTKKAETTTRSGKQKI